MGALETAIPNMWTIQGGYLKLWQSIAFKLKDIRLNTKDFKICRTSTGIKLTSNDGKIEEFDKLFIATPLNKLDFLDIEDEEHEIFSKILHYDYFTIIAQVKNLPKMGLYMLKKYCNDIPRYFPPKITYINSLFIEKNHLGIV